MTLLGANGVGRQPFRIARWHARLLAYNYTIEYKKGNENTVTDTLSWLLQDKYAVRPEPEDAVCFVSSCLTHQEFITATAQDPVLCQVMQWTTSGWPAAKTLPPEAMPFYRVRDELSVTNDLLLRGEQSVVPSSLISRLLEIAHESHPGITRTKQWLREKYW